MGYSIFDDTMVDMPWPQIEAAAARGAGVLLPVGIIEEHGPHLGLAVDTYAAYLVAVKARKLLAERGNEVLITPPQYWGISRATAVFGGTFSVSPETMRGLIFDIIACLAGWGFHKVFTVNWHADLVHCQVLYEAIGQARNRIGIDARFIASEFDMRRLRLSTDDPAILVEHSAPPIDTGSGPYVDIHAGSMETAVMMRYFPSGISPENVKTLQPTKLTMSDLKNFGRSEEETRRLVPDGYFGDPAAYDTIAAEAYIEAAAASCAGTIADYLASA